MNTRFLTSITVAACFLGLSSTAITQEKRPLEAQDVFALEYVSDPQVSPDGKSIVYVRRSNDIMTDKTRSNIWRVDIDGENHRPVLSGRDQYSSPRWSPDGDRIAYTSSVEGNTQLYVRYLDAPDSALLTNVQKTPSSISWSPDGKQIAFLMLVPGKAASIAKARKKPKGATWADAPKVIDSIPYQSDGRGIVETAYRHVFVISAQGGQPRQLTFGHFNHRGPLAWHPNEPKLLLSANRHPDWVRQSRESDVYELNVDTAKLTPLTNRPGTEQSPQYSHDGDRIAYIWGNNEPVSYRNTRLTMMNSDGTDPIILTEDLDTSIREFFWSANGKKLYMLFDERAKRTIGSVDLKKNIKRLVSDIGGTVLGRPYLGGSFHLGGGDVMAYPSALRGEPASLSVLRGKTSLPIVSFNTDLFRQVALSGVNEVVYASSLDGQEIQGWYVLPPNFDPEKKYPLIIEIHGGPFSAYGEFFSAEVQLMAAAGYVVFYNNHRGSTSYGEDFAMLLHGKYSSKDDFADHMSGIDAMIEKGFIDESNLFITGGSAGGIAAAYAIGLTDRFNAAVAAKPVINWISKTLTADSSVGQIRNQFPGYPWEHFETYWQRSPLSLVGNVTTPTLLITGEQDRRTPMSETEQYFQALQLLGIPSAMVRLPDSPHGIASRPSRLIVKVDHILAWFERYRKQD